MSYFKHMVESSGLWLRDDVIQYCCKADCGRIMERFVETSTLKKGMICMSCGFSERSDRDLEVQRSSEDLSYEERHQYIREPCSYPILIVINAFNNIELLLASKTQCSEIKCYSESYSTLPSVVRKSTEEMLRKIAPGWRNTFLDKRLTLYKFGQPAMGGMIFHGDEDDEMAANHVEAMGAEAMLLNVPFIRLREMISVCELKLTPASLVTAKIAQSQRFAFLMMRSTVQKISYDPDSILVSRNQFRTGTQHAQGKPLTASDAKISQYDAVRGFLCREMELTRREQSTGQVTGMFNLGIDDCMQPPISDSQVVKMTKVELAGSRMILVSPSGRHYMMDHEFLSSIYANCVRRTVNAVMKTKCLYFVYSRSHVMISPTGVIVYRGSLNDYPTCVKRFLEEFRTSLRDETVCSCIMSFKEIVIQEWVKGATTLKAEVDRVFESKG